MRSPQNAQTPLSHLNLGTSNVAALALSAIKCTAAENASAEVALSLTWRTGSIRNSALTGSLINGWIATSKTYRGTVRIAPSPTVSSSWQIHDSIPIPHQPSSQVRSLKLALIEREFACATPCKANQSRLVSVEELQLAQRLAIVYSKTRQIQSTPAWMTIATCPVRNNPNYRTRYLWELSGLLLPISPMFPL